jgi:high-affinity Fe2+/Pb2+ permease
MAFLAVGGPRSPITDASWDWWPLLGIALALWFIRSVLGRRLGAVELVLCLFAGLGFATVVHSWGILGGATIILILAATALVRRRAPRSPLPPSWPPV